MKMGPQEDYIETVFTCKGDFNDPNLHLQLEEFYEGLKSLLLTDSCQEKLILKKVEPWNSVRVTFNIPRAAALKLKQLAQQGDTNLRRLGVLAVQIEGDQSISLTIAGKNNERTELVFKTGSSDRSVEPSMSVLDAAVSGTSVEATRKNIAEYLRQGNALLDPLLSHLGGGSELLKSPNVVATSSDPIPFLSGGTSTVASTGKGPGLHSSPLHGLVSPPGRSPTGYPTSPSQGYMPSSSGRNIMGTMSQKYSSYPHGRPGAPPHARQTIGNLLLPPPPPYPHPQVVSVNNVQKQNRPMTSSSPLLVNLLQNDPSGGLLHSLAQGKLPELLDGSLDALALAKKKRKKKKRKQARLAAEAAAREAEMLLESVPNTTVVTSTSSASLPGFKKSVKKVKPSVSSGLAADHSTPLSDFVLEAAADKLVNPYTGLLEPADASGDSAAGSSVLPDNPEKIDTIQAAINRVAAAWATHVTSPEDTMSTNTSSVLTSSSSEMTTSLSPLLSIPQGTLPVHPMPLSTSPCISSLSAAPSLSKGTPMDTLASSSVCDRPTIDPHHRPYDINFSQSNKNNINNASESFHREPLLAMQHVTYSVGLPSGPQPSGPISTPSHMQPQFSMQEACAPRPTLAMSKASFNTGDLLFSRSGGLPGGHSALGSSMPERAKGFLMSGTGEPPHLPQRRHAGTPPHSVLRSPPMTSQAERPRSTGSYPLSQTGDGKGLAEVVSKIAPFLSTVANVHRGNSGPDSLTNERTRIQIQSSREACVSKTSPMSTQGQNVPPFLNTAPNETQPAYVHVNPKVVDMPKKGNDEINNSNHDSGLSSQSEAADENQLTDETTSSCGTQGSPPLTAADSLKLKVETQISKPSPTCIPTSYHPPPHHQTSLSGNPLYHKDTHAHAQAMVNSTEAATPHNPAVVGKNPTVLHWNTRDGVTSGSHLLGPGNPRLSAEMDSRQAEQQNVLLQKQCEKVEVHQVKCQSPENSHTIPSTKDGLVAHSRESDLSTCRPEISRHSVNVSSVADIRDSSHPAGLRDKGIFTVSPYRTQGYTPSVGAPASFCEGDTYGNYHKDIGRTVPIMSASVYQGHEGKGIGEPTDVKPRLQSSAIGVVPGLPDLRTAKLFDNASSAYPESHTDTVTKNLRLYKPTTHDSGSTVSVSSGVPLAYKTHLDSAPRIGAISSHSSSGNITHGCPSSVQDTYATNSHGSQNVPISSFWKETSVSRTQSTVTSSVPQISENCLSNSNLGRSQAEALNYNQHYVNPLNVQMCNTTSSVTTTSSLEAAYGTITSTASSVKTDPYTRTSHPHGTAVVRTSVSQSQVKMPQIQKVNAQGEVNGPVDGGEKMNFQHDKTNCHSMDFAGQDSDNTIECLVKSGSLSMSMHQSLPIISGDILDQEFIKNCNSNDLQTLEENVVQNYFSAESTLSVQRGIVAGGKSPGVQTASLQAGSPDHLKGSNVTSMYTRKSPTGKAGAAGNMLNMFASGLPLPKLLTESIQKVVKPLPGSAKDLEGSLKVGRRNQGPSHTNLLSHSSSAYSKSPPLGYDSVQGASSVLTPPKSPVRFGSETMSMGIPKPQSPRMRSPHVSHAPSSFPLLPQSNLPIPSSVNNVALPRATEPSFPADGVDHNGQEIPKPDVIQSSEPINNGPPSAQASVDSVHIQSWNGANTQTSGQQQITCEQMSVENNLARVEQTTGSVSGTGTTVSESNTVTTGDVHVAVSDSTLPDEPSAIQNSKTEHCGNQVHTGVSEHSEGPRVQDLCKANLSCPSQSSIMHPMLRVETLPCDQTTVDNTSELIVDTASAPLVQTEQCQGVQESATLQNRPHPTAGSENMDMVQIPENVGTTPVQINDTACGGSENMENVQENNPEDANRNVSETGLDSVEGTHSDITAVQLSSAVAVCPETVQLQVEQSSTSIVPKESETTCSSSMVPAVGPEAVPATVACIEEASLEAGVVVQEPNPTVQSDDVECKITSGNPMEPSLSNPKISAVESNGPPVEQNISEDLSGELQLQNPAEQEISPAAHDGESGEGKNPSFVSADLTNEVQHAAGEDKPAHVEPAAESIADDSQNVPLPAVVDETPVLETQVEEGTKPVKEMQQSLETLPVPETMPVDGAQLVDGTKPMDGTKVEEEHHRQQRSTRKSSEAEAAVISKTLRGGKLIEAEAPRVGRAIKTPKRRDEDNGNKTSPEVDASPQLRQRRSRRRLPEAEGYALEHTTAKRSRVDGLEDAHADLADHDGVLMDGESNDSASCDHNDVGETADHGGIEGTQLDNAHPDLAAKNIIDEKSGSRRRGSDASKPALRDSKRDVKQNATITDNDLKGRGKASERVLRANEEEHVTRSSRRNRQSPSGVLDKAATPASRDRSPVSRMRNKTPDQREESPDQQYKRTTRSTKPKDHPEPVTTNRRRRTSRDHR